MLMSVEGKMCGGMSYADDRCVSAGEESLLVKSQ